MPQKSEKVTCIYCKQPRDPGREHLLPRSLGGSLVVPFVCQGCNTGFSHIDEALAARSFVTLSRLARTAPEQEIGRALGDNFVQIPEGGLWHDVRLGAGMRPTLFPQVHLVEGKLSVMVPDEQGRDALFSFIDRKVGDGSLTSMFVKVGPADRCTAPRLVKHRDKDGFVRAPTLEAGREFLQLLAEKWAGRRADPGNQAEPAMQRMDNPSIDIRASFVLDDMYRAVAKIALSYLAFAHGTAFACRPEFDEVREYIKGHVVHQPPVVEDQILVDSRFVVQLDYGQTALPTETHAIMLFPSDGALFAFVSLYKDNGFVVKLGALPADNSFQQPLDAAWDAYEFSTNRTWHQKIGLRDLLQRMTTSRTMVRP